MKHLKKVLVALCAFVLALGFVTPALATGTITIADPVEGTTYNAYKIFDVTESEGELVYTLNDSHWIGILLEKNGDAITSKVPGLEFVDNGNNGYTVFKLGDFKAADFAKFLRGNGDANLDGLGTSTVTTSGGAATITGLTDGYYLVISNKDSQNRVKASLTTVYGNAVTIQDKNDMPFDKVIVDDGTEKKEDGVQVGDTVSFKIESEIPTDVTADNASTYIFRIDDKMDAGLTFVTPIAVKIDNAPIELIEITDATNDLTGNKVRYGTNGMAFELSLSMLNGNTPYEPGESIEITYSAVVNDQAVSKVSENNAYLSYGESFEKLINKDSQTKVYTSSIIIDKFETGAPEQKLAGAKFILKNSEDKYYKETKDNNGKITKIEWIAPNPEEGQTTDQWLAAQLEAATPAITIVTTNTNGRADFMGLLDGTYQLIELEAPKDYVKLTTPVTVEVDGSNSTAVGMAADQIIWALTNIEHINNTPGSLLPSTGGMGTTLLYIAGAAGLVVYLLTSRRKKAVQE